MRELLYGAEAYKEASLQDISLLRAILAVDLTFRAFSLRNCTLLM
jgi:hypothetical protein